MKISVIMSAYNAEKTITKAIKSVLNQSYSNLELIIVNDCSIDKTLDKIKEFNDSRIILVNNETNLGAGMARRIGLTKITGDYTTFIDSDDYIEPDMYKTYVNYILQYNADIVTGGYIVESDNNKILNVKIPEFRFDFDEDRFKPNSKDTKRYLWACLIKSNLWKSVQYSHRRYIEDTPTAFKLTFFSKNILNIPYAGYHYVQYNTSLIHTASALKNKIYYCLAAKDNTEFLKEQGAEYDYKTFKAKMRDLKAYNRKEWNKYKEEIKELFEYENLIINEK